MSFEMEARNVRRAYSSRPVITVVLVGPAKSSHAPGWFGRKCSQQLIPYDIGAAFVFGPVAQQAPTSSCTHSGPFMTKILKTVSAALFMDKVNRLRTAFRAACAPFHAELKTLEAEHSAHAVKVKSGEAVWEEFDPETGYGWSYGEDLAERRYDAEDALLVIRKAFIMTAYHHWERGAQRWGKSDKSHKDLVKALGKVAIEVDDRLEELHLLVNCLKHNSKTATKLMEKRPSLFATDFDPDALHPVTGKPFARIDWADNIVLTDADVDDYLNVVRNSGPK